MVDNHNYMCRICAKVFSDSNFNQAVIDKYVSFFNDCSKFHILANNSKSKSITEKKTTCFYHYFKEGTYQEHPFSFLAVVNSWTGMKLFGNQKKNTIKQNNIKNQNKGRQKQTKRIKKKGTWIYRE